MRAERRPETLEARTVLSSGYLQLSVAADRADAALVQDPNLISPWGIAVNSSGGDLWIADKGSGMASLYVGGVGGTPLAADSLAVTLPGGSPTGAVANGSTGFVVQSGASSGPASYLFASDTGKISGWNADVPPPAPSSAAQQAAATAGAVYKGLAVANDIGTDLLYAADFHNNRIDVFDSSFNPVTLVGGFTDPNLPAGYAPFNVANIGGRLLVTYAVQDSAKQNDSPGVGHGIIDAFAYNGNFQGRLVTGGPLNSPWGIALAPANFGDFSGQLLVANSGDGKINAFDPTTGAYQGTLGGPTGNPLVINGLHGLSFGNGLTAGNGNALFYTAVGNGGDRGLVGEIVSAQTTPFPVLGSVLSPVAQVNFSGVVAVFNDTHASLASGFSVQINWGDGFATTGTVTALPSGGFLVSGGHEYSQAGHETITVQIHDPQSASATATAAANVSPPGLVFSATSVAATEGIRFSGAVASFIDQDHNGSSSPYTNAIDWGDGTTTVGTLSQGFVSPFTLTGSHTYATAGTYPITVTIDDTDGATGTEHVTATAVTSLSGTSKTIAPTEATAFSGTVASFSDANTNQNLNDYAATIDWGDGTVSLGTISPDGDGYDVSGSHAYENYGDETVHVTISDPGSTITVASAANVADANTLTAAALPVTAAEGSVFSGDVATFSDTLASTPAGVFSATIDWGDGVTTAGTVTGVAGLFTISGSHTYVDEGAFTVKSTVKDIGGTASSTASSSASVADTNVLAMTPINVTAVAGAVFSGAVATVSDTNLTAPRSIFHATINWGDGVTTPAAVLGGNGAFVVTGSHIYAQEGSYAPVVTMADHSPGTASATATSTAEVAAAPPTVTAAAVSGAERTPLAVKVATFDQPGANITAADYTATIVWGDGATSAGTVTSDGAGFDISGAHTYADEGHYALQVAVTRTGGTSGTAHGTATIVEPPLADGTNGNPNTRWINELYGDLLSRQADLGALTFWSGQLSAGVPRIQIVNSIEASAEYRGDEVQRVFQTYLKRPAEASAVTFGTGYLANHTLEQFMALVVGSGEFYQGQGGGTNDGFLDALFHDALNRPVDAGARAYFDHLLAGGVSTTEVAATIFASNEYLDDVVQSIYLTYLDRPADAGGQVYFAGLLQQGATDQQVAATLIASDEYFAKTAE
ncbi:MAG TPA: TIGR03118 family protein [Pirellulales bacterium]|nr:TIGR03118 family protein [Pirellulales bacterium]